MTDIGKGLAVLGILIVVAGGVFMLLGRANVPLGRLPGDLVYRGKNSTVYFPLMTSHRGECGVVGGALFCQPLSAVNASPSRNLYCQLFRGQECPRHTCKIETATSC